jgi:hypothetical protein
VKITIILLFIYFITCSQSNYFSEDDNYVGTLKKDDFVLKLGALIQRGNSSVIYDELVLYNIENC